MRQCRMCRKVCESNSLLKDRTFREKFQDIICMWVEVANGPILSDVCQECATDILEFYSYKHQCRQILREKGSSHSLEGNQSPVWSSEEVTTEPGVVLMRSKALISEKARKPWWPRTPADHLAEKMRPKRALRRKTEAEKAMDPREYRRDYFRKANQKYKHTCELCGRRIPKNLMEGHMNSHKGISPYTCEFCGKCFACKHYRRNHISRMHVVGKEVSCPECVKIFTCPGTLKIHMRKVHRDRQYLCSLCGLKILDKKSLQHHMNIHTQTRDFKCPHCEKAFYCSSALKIHLRTHSGEKPYICNFCPKRFVNRRIYVMHMQKLHPQEPLMKLDGTKFRLSSY